MSNYYKILNVEYDALPEDIKKSYISLAKKYHPDTTVLDKNEAEKTMKEINLAYDTLSDAKKRAEYDRGINVNGKNVEHNSSEYTIFIVLVNTVNIVCAETIDAIKNIPPKANPAILNKILNVFQKKVAAHVKEIVESPFMEGDSLEAVGIVYYMLGAEYFSIEYFEQSKCMNNLALAFLPKDKNLYKEALKAKQIILNAIKATHVNNVKSVFAKPVLYIFLLIAFILFTNFTEGDQKSVRNSRSQDAVASKVKISEPVPKKGIASGYIPESPVLNNTGLCQLTIDNIQNNAPVYVRLWDIGKSKAPVRTINIAANSSFTLRNINPGVYEIRYKYIYENVEADTGSKSETFNLQQTETHEGSKYSIVRITLYKVANGNSRTYKISGNDV